MSDPIGWHIPPRGTDARAVAELQAALRRFVRVFKREALTDVERAVRWWQQR